MSDQPTNESRDWFLANRAALATSEYAGRYVLVRQCRVIDSDAEITKLLRRNDMTGKHQFFIGFAGDQLAVGAGGAKT